LYKRFFAFGCSFTLYKWPTWADYLYAGGVAHKYENWALPGGSNDFIFHSLMECDAPNKITRDDLVAIMWSQPFRLSDYWHNRGWDMPGNVYLFQPKDRIARYWSDDQNTLENLSYMWSAKRLLDLIGCDYNFFSMVKFRLRDDYSAKFSHVQNSIEISMEEFLGYTDTEHSDTDWRQTLPGDFHPSPMEHANFAKSRNIKINLDTRKIDKLQSAADDYIFNSKNPHKQEINVFPEKFPLTRLPNISGKFNSGSGRLRDVNTVQPFNW